MTDKPDRPALKARAERYRELAAEVLRLKQGSASQETHAAYVNLAAGWKSLADKIETTLEGSADSQTRVSNDDSGEA